MLIPWGYAELGPSILCCSFQGGTSGIYTLEIGVCVLLLTWMKRSMPKREASNPTVSVDPAAAALEQRRTQQIRQAKRASLAFNLLRKKDARHLCVLLGLMEYEGASDSAQHKAVPAVGAVQQF